MSKNVIFESFKYRFLCAAQAIDDKILVSNEVSWSDFINHLEFTVQTGRIDITWKIGTPGKISRSLSEPHFYTRGDIEERTKIQGLLELNTVLDPVHLENGVYFNKLAKQVAELSGYQIIEAGVGSQSIRYNQERFFHDAWANSEDVDSINVIAVNQACTAPEMRYIASRLGDLHGKRLLDVGCGLGEASVFFALRGANVTSSDLSQGMLDATCRLARINGVSVTPIMASAEDLKLSFDELFDIVYAGNLLHHVNIEQVLIRLKQHLAPGGLLITWDPMAYNPIINIYRAFATQVRTFDEHPLRLRDIGLFRRYFYRVETRYFWLTSLFIFVIMVFVQRRNPNKERFWKVVVQEGEKWRWLYAPLEKIDKIVLFLFPPLRWLCWNVVVCASLPREGANCK